MPLRKKMSYKDYIYGIKLLSIEEQLNLLKIISNEVKNNFQKNNQKRSVMELEGLGADIWKGIDVQDYIRKERESWD